MASTTTLNATDSLNAIIALERQSPLRGFLPRLDESFRKYELHEGRDDGEDYFEEMRLNCCRTAFTTRRIEFAYTSHVLKEYGLRMRRLFTVIAVFSMVFSLFELVQSFPQSRFRWMLRFLVAVVSFGFALSTHATAFHQHTRAGVWLVYLWSALGIVAVALVELLIAIVVQDFTPPLSIFAMMLGVYGLNTLPWTFPTAVCLTVSCMWQLFIGLRGKLEPHDQIVTAFAFGAVNVIGAVAAFANQLVTRHDYATTIVLRRLFQMDEDRNHVFHEFIQTVLPDSCILRYMEFYTKTLFKPRQESGLWNNAAEVAPFDEAQQVLDTHVPAAPAPAPPRAEAQAQAEASEPRDDSALLDDDDDDGDLEAAEANVIAGFHHETPSPPAPTTQTNVSFVVLRIDGLNQEVARRVAGAVNSLDSADDEEQTAALDEALEASDNPERIGAAHAVGVFVPVPAFDWLLDLMYTLEHGIYDQKINFEILRVHGEYIVAIGGVEHTNPDHIVTAIDCAHEMRKSINSIAEKHGFAFVPHIGVASGDMTSGVLGRDGVCFDVASAALDRAYELADTALSHRGGIAVDAKHILALPGDAFVWEVPEEPRSPNSGYLPGLSSSTDAGASPQSSRASSTYSYYDTDERLWESDMRILLRRNPDAATRKHSIFADYRLPALVFHDTYDTDGMRAPIIETRSPALPSAGRAFEYDDVEAENEWNPSFCVWRRAMVHPSPDGIPRGWSARRRSSARSGSSNLSGTAALAAATTGADEEDTLRVCMCGRYSHKIILNVPSSGSSSQGDAPRELHAIVRPDLEPVFWRHLNIVSRPFAALSLLLGFVVYALFGVWDALVLPSAEQLAEHSGEGGSVSAQHALDSERHLAILYGVLVPFALMCAGALACAPRRTILISLVWLLGSAGLNVGLAIFTPPQNYLYVGTRLLMVIIYSSLFVRMKLLGTELVLGLVLVAYTFAAAFLLPFYPANANTLLHLCSASAIGLLTSYSNDKAFECAFIVQMTQQRCNREVFRRLQMTQMIVHRLFPEEVLFHLKSWRGVWCHASASLLVAEISWSSAPQSELDSFKALKALYDQFDAALLVLNARFAGAVAAHKVHSVGRRYIVLFHRVGTPLDFGRRDAPASPNSPPSSGEEAMAGVLGSDESDAAPSSGNEHWSTSRSASPGGGESGRSFGLRHGSRSPSPSGDYAAECEVASAAAEFAYALSKLLRRDGTDAAEANSYSAGSAIRLNCAIASGHTASALVGDSKSFYNVWGAVVTTANSILKEYGRAPASCFARVCARSSSRLRGGRFTQFPTVSGLGKYLSSPTPARLPAPLGMRAIVAVETSSSSDLERGDGERPTDERNAQPVSAGDFDDMTSSGSGSGSVDVSSGASADVFRLRP